MDIALHRVTPSGRLNLGDLATPGVEFYTGERGDGGVVTLKPVRVVDAGVKRGLADAVVADRDDDEDDPF